MVTVQGKGQGQEPAFSKELPEERHTDSPGLARSQEATSSTRGNDNNVLIPSPPMARPDNMDVIAGGEGDRGGEVLGFFDVIHE